MLGDKFTQWNPPTERLEYLHIQQSMLDVFTRKWAMISTSKVVGKASGQKQGEQENGKQKEGEQENGEHKEGKQENGKHKKDEQEHGQLKKGEQESAEHKEDEQACVTKWNLTCSV